MACVLCNEERTPNGQTIRGKFYCNSCDREWILEKRKISRFPQLYTSKSNAEIILEFISLFTSILEPQDMLDRLSKMVTNRLNKNGCTIFFYQQEHNSLNLISNFHSKISNPQTLNGKTLEQNPANKIFWNCIESHTPEYFKVSIGAGGFFLDYLSLVGATEVLLLPIYFKSTPLAVMMVDYGSGQEKNYQKESYLFQLIAGQLSVSLRNILLYQKSKKQSENFQNLHIAALTLSRLYFENNSEMIKMILLTLSGFVMTDVNILLEKHRESGSVQLNKLTRSDAGINLESISLNEIKSKDFESLFLFKEAECVSRENFPKLEQYGLTGSWVLILPLYSDEGNFFTFLLGWNSSKKFTIDDIEVLKAFSSQAKITIENSLLYQKMAQNQRLEKEIEIAKEIQNALLPQQMPYHSNYSFAGMMMPARGIGGDYFDIIMNPTGGDALICIGDVSGKGIPAGLVMATVRTIIHSLVRKEFTTWEIINDVNTYIYHNYSSSPLPRFMSIIVIRWDGKSNEFYYSGAGHGDIYIYRRQKQQIEIIPTKGIILGIKPDINEYYNKGSFKLDPGDTLLMFTDGSTEAMNRFNDQFDEARLIHSFIENAGSEPDEILTGIFKDLKDFTEGFEQSDDITFFAVKRKTS